MDSALVGLGILLIVFGVVLIGLGLNEYASALTMWAKTEKLAGEVRADAEANVAQLKHVQELNDSTRQLLNDVHQHLHPLGEN